MGSYYRWMVNQSRRQRWNRRRQRNRERDRRRRQHVRDQDQYGLSSAQVYQVRDTLSCDLCYRKWEEVAHAEWKREDNIDHCHDCGMVRGALCFRCNYHIVGALEQGKFVKTRLYRQAEAYILGGGAGRLKGRGGFGCVCPQRVLVERLRQSTKSPRGMSSSGSSGVARSAQPDRRSSERGSLSNGDGVRAAGVAGSAVGGAVAAGPVSVGVGGGGARVVGVKRFPEAQELMCRLADAGKRDCTVAVRSEPTRDNPRAVAVFVWDNEGVCWKRAGWLPEPPTAADGLVGQIRRSVKNPGNPGLLVMWPPIERSRGSVESAGGVPDRSGGRSIGGL